MHITDVILFQLSGPYTGPTFTGQRQSQPIDMYPSADEYAAPERRDPPKRAKGIYVQVQTDEGVNGMFGPIDRSQAFIIHTELRPFLLGRDPLATEFLLDAMIRLHRHGRSGMFMTGVSPIDCALWDLKGRAWNQPIYRLLGGPTRPAVPAYASMLGFSIEPEEAAQTASVYKAKGFSAQKWFFRYGPRHGAEGMARNLAMAAAVREAVGPGYRLMFDAFMSWDVTYAKKMVQGLEPLDPTWMEEPVPPERVSELRRIREASRVPIATGEHVFTRWQTKELLVNQAVDWLQNDPDWTGGITELVKIVALASSFEVPVIAHGHSLLSALHVAGASSPAAVPMVEYLVAYQPMKQFFHTPIYEPVDGEISLPNQPGLGIRLDESKFDQQETLVF